MNEHANPGESAQPQLPPRPERVTDESGFYTLYQAYEVDAYMNSLQVENESLKAQLDERNNRGTGYLYVPKAQYDALMVERDKLLEVVREYREAATRYIHPPVPVEAKEKPPCICDHAYNLHWPESRDEYKLTRCSYLGCDCERYKPADHNQLKPQPASISSEPMPDQLVSEELLNAWADYKVNIRRPLIRDFAIELRQWRKWAAAKGQQ